MKKLMIALATVACAAGLQAATALNWKVSDGVGDGYKDGEGMYSGQFYIFNANVTGIDQQSILTAIIEGGALTDFTSIDNTSMSGGTMSSKKISDSTPTWALSNPVRHDDDKNLDYIDYFYAAVGTDESGNDYVFLSETFSAQVQTSKNTSLSSSIYDGSILKTDSATFSGTQWYATSVPEPTSGLLLLLGVAGLALRRRRA